MGRFNLKKFLIKWDLDIILGKVNLMKEYK